VLVSHLPAAATPEPPWQHQHNYRTASSCKKQRSRSLNCLQQSIQRYIAYNKENVGYIDNVQRRGRTMAHDGYCQPPSATNKQLFWGYAHKALPPQLCSILLSPVASKTRMYLVDLRQKNGISRPKCGIPTKMSVASIAHIKAIPGLFISEYKSSYCI